MSAPRNAFSNLDEQLDSFGVPRKVAARTSRREDQLKRCEATRRAIEQARMDGATEMQFDDQIRVGTEQPKPISAMSGPMITVHILRSLFLGFLSFSHLFNGKFVTYIDRHVYILPAWLQELLSNIVVHLLFGIIIAVAHACFCRWLAPKPVMRQHSIRMSSWNRFRWRQAR